MVLLLPRLPADPEVLYLHAKACFDCDHKDNLGGYNIQTYLEMLQVRYGCGCVRGAIANARNRRTTVLGPSSGDPALFIGRKEKCACLPFPPRLMFASGACRCSRSVRRASRACYPGTVEVLPWLIYWVFRENTHALVVFWGASCVHSTPLFCCIHSTPLHSTPIRSDPLQPTPIQSKPRREIPSSRWARTTSWRGGSRPSCAAWATPSSTSRTRPRCGRPRRASSSRSTTADGSRRRRSTPNNGLAQQLVPHLRDPPPPPPPCVIPSQTTYILYLSGGGEFRVLFGRQF